MSAPSILVVDPDELHATACASFLEDSGFAVTVAGDLSSATDALAVGTPDLVLFESSLGSSATLALVEKARRQGAEVFGMSDVFVGPTNHAIAVGLHGVVDHWTKPVDPSTALEWFERVLADRFPTPEAADASVGPTEGEPWADRPTSVTPIPAAEAVDAQPETDFENEVEAGEISEVPDVQAADTAVAATPGLSDGEAKRAEAKERAANESGGESESADRDWEVPQRFVVEDETAGGDLAGTTFAAVFAACLNRVTSGAIRVSTDGVSKEVFFADGAVLGVRSDVPDDGLGAILLGDGLLRKDQADAINRNLGASALEIPETFVDAGVLSEADVATIERIVTERRLQTLFASETGHWALTKQSCPSAVRISLPADGGLLLERGVRFGLPTQLVRDALDGMLRCPAGWRTAPPSGPFLGWEQAIIDRIDGSRRMSRVILGAPDRDEALRFVALLVVLGHVGFEP